MAVDPQLRDLARRMENVERQARQRKLPTLAFSAIDDGAITAVDADGNLTAIFGKQHDGTTAPVIVSGPIPPRPLLPLVTAAPGALRVYWDGTFVNAVAPMDFSRVTVYAVPLEEFSIANPLDQTKIIGEINSATGGEVSASLTPGQEYAIFLSTWTLPGRFSTPSDIATAIVGEVPAGSQGVPGPPGADGESLYTWIKYGDNAVGLNMSDDPFGKTYIGLAYNKTSPSESPNAADYTWALIKGADGQDGQDGAPGIPGEPGADGQTTYTWIKYGTSAAGAGLSDDPTGKTYIGIAYNKTTPVESTTPGDYTWSLIQGPQGSQGIQGPAGPDGQSLYTWIKYATTPTTGMSDSPTGKDYMGIALNKTSATESTAYADYTWSLIKGANGAPGSSLYTWVKYADTSTGGGMSDDPTGKIYIGLAYNKTSATESTTATDYTWSLFRGDSDIPAPTSSPVPVTTVGPASVVVNYQPIFGTVTDLHLWQPPVPAEGSDYDAPTGITPDASTLHTQEFPPGGFIYANQAGIPLDPGRPVWVALQARNVTPPAAPPSEWVQSSAGAIDPAYLELLAGSVIAQRLQAETLTGVTITGSVLDILDALYAEPGYMEVKADLVEAKSAIFSDNVTRRGTNNYLEGTETASAGITDPGTPPTLSATWPSVEFEGTWNITGIHVDETTREVFAVTSNPLAVRVYNLDTGAYKRNLSWVTDYDRVGVDITRYGDWFYIASYDNTAASDDTIHLWRYSALSANEGVRDATYDQTINPLANQQNPQAFVIGADSAGEITQIWISENQVWRVRRYVADTYVITRPGTALPYPAGGADSTWALAGLTVTVDGADRQMVCQPYHGDAITWGQYSGVLTLDDQNSRVRPFGEVVVAADGNYTFDAYQNLYHHKPLPDTQGTREWSYTWYDSDPAGDGLAETMKSPERSYLSPKGAYIRIKTPMPPDDGTVDAPNTVRIYCGDVLQGTHFTDLELAAGRIVVGPDFSSGIQPPTESGFANRTSLLPGAYESSKGDANGAMWRLEGTGAGRVGPLEWDANGDRVNPDWVSSTQAYALTGSTPITITHGLGVVPSAVIAQQASHVGQSLNFIVLDSTATTFNLYCKDDANAYISGTRTVSWVAYR